MALSYHQTKKLSIILNKNFLLFIFSLFFRDYARIIE